MIMITNNFLVYIFIFLSYLECSLLREKFTVKHLYQGWGDSV